LPELFQEWCGWRAAPLVSRAWDAVSLVVIFSPDRRHQQDQRRHGRIIP
jgi:hypothetical protein